MLNFLKTNKVQSTQLTKRAFVVYSDGYNKHIYNTTVAKALEHKAQDNWHTFKIFSNGQVAQRFFHTLNV